jgi:hypothetical protein
VSDLPRSLRIERSGGLGGMKACADLAPDALTPPQRKALTALLQRKAPGARSAPSTPCGPDRFTYRLHVVDADGSNRTLVIAEDDMPGALQALVKPALP